MIVFIAFEVFFMFNRTDKIKVAGVKSDRCPGGPALHSPVAVDKPHPLQKDPPGDTSFRAAKYRHDVFRLRNHLI
jgi:hypothetical protein